MLFVALSLYMFFLTLGTDIWYLLQVTCGMFGDALSVQAKLKNVCYTSQHLCMKQKEVKVFLYLIAM